MNSALDYAKKLVALLENPQPGLTTWQEAVGRVWARLMQEMNEPEA